MSILDQGLEPRLFPITRSEEDRATSYLLSTFLSVAEFRRALMETVGRKTLRSGTDIEAFLHPSFDGKYSQKCIPDGLIVHDRGDKWQSTIEVKLKSSELTLPQLEKYLEETVEHKLDALITISNELCQSPDRPPLRLKSSSRALSKVPHFHWSWKFIEHTARHCLSAGIENETQKYMLAEFVRFLRTEGSGVSGFTSMSKVWSTVVDDLKARVSPEQEELETIVSDWHQECAELQLQLSDCLGKHTPLLKEKKKFRQEEQLERDVNLLRDKGDLTAKFDVDGKKHPLCVELELDQRVLRVSKRYDAPTSAKRSLTQIEHFLRRFLNEGELDTAQHEGVHIQVKWAYVSEPKSTTLFDALQDYVNGDLQKNRLMIEESRPIVWIELRYSPPRSTAKVANKKKVIELLESSVEHFCDHYLFP